MGLCKAVYRRFGIQSIFKRILKILKPQTHIFMKTKSILLTSSALLLAGSLSAAITSTNFMPKSPDNPWPWVSDDSAIGVVPAQNWNNINLDSNDGTEGLNLADGTASGADFEDFRFANGATQPAGAEDDDIEMMNSGGRIDLSFGTDQLFTVSNLPTDFTSNGYDVYLYFAEAAPDDIGGEFHVTIGSDQQYIDVTDYSGSYALASGVQGSSTGNYLKFSGQSGSSFTAIAGPTDGTAQKYGYLAGMQVVAVPEPSLFAWALGAGALVWVGIRRRRKA